MLNFLQRRRKWNRNRATTTVERTSSRSSTHFYSSDRPPKNHSGTKLCVLRHHLLCGFSSGFWADSRPLLVKEPSKGSLVAGVDKNAGEYCDTLTQLGGSRGGFSRVSLPLESCSPLKEVWGCLSRLARSDGLLLIGTSKDPVADWLIRWWHCSQGWGHSCACILLCGRCCGCHACSCRASLWNILYAYQLWAAKYAALKGCHLCRCWKEGMHLGLSVVHSNLHATNFLL